MDEKSCELMERMEKVTLRELGDAELERLERSWRREAGSWFRRRGEAYWKERSVIRREDDVDGRASVTKDEEQVLRWGWAEFLCSSASLSRVHSARTELNWTAQVALVTRPSRRAFNGHARQRHDLIGWTKLGRLVLDDFCARAFQWECSVTVYTGVHELEFTSV